MSGQSTEDFLGYWTEEGEAYARRGDYAWMAGLVPGQRVLEIGCGVGFGTRALVDRGLQVLALDVLPACLAATEARMRRQGNDKIRFMQVDLQTLNDAQHAEIGVFSPDAVVCWLMGAPSDLTGATEGDAGRAVSAYREQLHRLSAQLAASLPTVRWLHLVDRTAIPWQAKDLGRDTLIRYHVMKTLLDLPFAVDRRQALYRKIDDKAVEMGLLRQMHPGLKGVVPVLASLLAERKL